MPYVGHLAVLIASDNRVRTPKSEHHVGPFVHLSEVVRPVKSAFCTA